MLCKTAFLAYNWPIKGRFADIYLNYIQKRKFGIRLKTNIIASSRVVMRGPRSVTGRLVAPFVSTEDQNI